MTDDAPTPLPPAILDRLHRELTAEMLERVAKYARRRARVKRRAGVPCFDLDAEAEVMAQDAASATVLGQRVWNPEVPLFEHLCGVVRSESTKEIERQRRFQHRPVEHVVKDERLEATMAARGTPRSARPGRVISMADACRPLVEGLRVMARGDDHVNQLLDAYLAGVGPDDRAGVIELTGMSTADYRNARRRLDRMVVALPDGLEDGAHDALEVTYGY